MTESEKLTEKWLTIEGMRIFGGSFACALAEAYAHADSNNTEKIERAFPEILEQHLKLAKQKKLDERYK